ncbi:MAG: Fe2+-dependent dioxygenase [Limnobacter sp.]|uniref:Fe2+-dependent dioxygenase n=1 Tax=Limnobacter sp. TaxID=2003368 RepID=UPI0022C30979|nr:Fe2+-dependent dioxygenase [Limnobacter sp.]MCZ8014563.1 Fe2+-dependent dioxygenase [Limnobacter sp.]
MLVTIENVLNADELENVRALLARADWATGQSAGSQARLAKNNLQIPEGSELLRDLRVLVMRALNKSSRLISAALPYKILPPNFNRYTGSTNSYGLHTDSTLRYLPDGSALRTDISATLFLSNPGDYDGGELVVEDTYGEHRVKLNAGSLVVYPSGSMHAVAPVTRGERLACYMFMQSMVKDVECRRMLFQMDESLIKLRQEYGEANPELIRLTGLYNNLLRRWTDC